jgi:hypothetical protein
LVENFIVDDLPEVRTQRRLTAADVDVEHLHLAQLVDDREALGGRELAGVSATRRRQAVHTGEVAAVGQLPGDAHGRVQPERHPVDERRRRGRRVSGHR